MMKPGVFSRRKLPPMLFGVARRAQSGLEPYIPSASQPWDAVRAGHLLRRATFLPTLAILLSQNPQYEKLESRGIGEAPDLYDNNLPEGRFYCRTVSVEVATPVK